MKRYGLWVSDGTETGTVLLQQFVSGTQTQPGGPRYLTAAGRRLFFSAFDRTNGKQLWALDLHGIVELFVRGDSNSDARLNISDAVFTLGYLFTGGPLPSCLDAADSNDDGTIDISDAIAVLSYLFLGTGDLAEPFEECGIDPTEDEVGCGSFPPCE